MFAKTMFRSAANVKSVSGHGDAVVKIGFKKRFPAIPELIFAVFRISRSYDQRFPNSFVIMSKHCTSELAINTKITPVQNTFDSSTSFSCRLLSPTRKHVGRIAALTVTGRNHNREIFYNTTIPG